MGAAASLFKRKKKEDAAEEKGAEPANQAAKPKEEEEEEVLGDIEEVFCRIAQVHHAQSRKRWERITKKINRIMKKKNIPTEYLKRSLEKEGLGLPSCWEKEMAEVERKRKEKEERRLKREQEEAARKANTKVKAKAKADATSPKKGRTGFFSRTRKGKVEPEPVEEDLPIDKAIDKKRKGAKSKVQGESDTEPETDDSDEDSQASEAEAEEEEAPGQEPFVPLSKYEVFAYMKKLHKHLGEDIVASDDMKKEREDALEVMGRVYVDMSAAGVRAISQENRIRDRLGHDSLVYGEIDNESLLKVLQKLRRVHGHMIQAGGSFWDLGAGVGKTVVAAALMHDFETCYGIEILEEVRNTSRFALQKWRKEECPRLGPSKSGIVVDFLQDDCVHFEGWVKDASMLLVHTNLTPADMNLVRAKADGLSVGSLCLSVSLAAVTEDKWGLVAVENVKTSWGKTKLYAHEKLVP